MWKRTRKGERSDKKEKNRVCAPPNAVVACPLQLPAGGQEVPSVAYGDNRIGKSDNRVGEGDSRVGEIVQQARGPGASRGRLGGRESGIKVR